MPIYDCLCPNCGPINDVWAKVQEMAPKCRECGAPMRRLISPTNIICDIAPYVDTEMDAKPTPVFSRQHKQEELKKRGLAIK